MNTTDPVEPSSENKRGSISRRLTEQVLRNLYVKEKKTLQEIADIYQCSRQNIKKLMDKYNINRRRRSDARVLAIRKGKFNKFQSYTINEDFFNKWSPQMAWVLGLLFTDGYIEQGKIAPRVVLSSIDYELLEKVRNHMKSNQPITESKQSYDKTKSIYKFEFYREKLRNDLIYLGLYQKKSRTVLFPKIPSTYMSHFIRGCWDGDGSVYFEHKDKLRASYISGSYEFMRVLVDILFQTGITRIRIYNGEERAYFAKHNIRSPYPLKIHTQIYKTKKGESSAYYINITSRENLFNLFNYFYDGVDMSMCLSRKYILFWQGIQRLDPHTTIALHHANKKDISETPLCDDEEEIRKVRDFPVRESEKVDLKVYFPDISFSEKVRLFGKEWLRKNTHYKNKD